MRLRHSICLAAGVLAIGFTTPAMATPLYHVTYLAASGTLGINSSGQIVGGIGGSAFVYSNGTLTTFAPPGASVTDASAINNSGQIVGYSTSTTGSTGAYLYSNNTFTSLGILPGYVASYANAVNSSGAVAGTLDESGNGGSHAFVYSNGVMVDLGTLGGTTSYGYGIDAAGEVVGSAELADTFYHPFLYSNGTMIDLGPSGSVEGDAVGINNSGEIAGWYSGTSGGKSFTHPFVYSDGVFQDIGTFDGQTQVFATAINDFGDVVGNTNQSLGAANRPPFLYTNGTMYDLNNLLDSSGAGLTLELAFDINDSGWIVAEGATASGYKDVLLTPVPEPSSVFLAIAGLAAFGLWRVGYRERRGQVRS